MQYISAHQPHYTMKSTLIKDKNTYIAIGLMAGVVIGSVTDNIGLWLPIGMLLGIAASKRLGEDSKKDSAVETEAEEKE